MEKNQNVKNQKKVKVISSIGVIVLVIVLIAMLIISLTKKQGGVITAELAKAMTYAEVKEGDEIVAEAPNVRFDAFFLRDINNDGYAESLRGTCKEIGSEDTLYMELNVVTAGYLKNAKITINGANFYLQTALPKDDELKDNYIGNNIKTIEFNDIANGTQKMITGIVRSGDYSVTSKKVNAIENNINNYSKVNSVTLTGTYVDEVGQETPISKTVEFDVDWYGETRASISTIKLNKSIENCIDEEKGVINLDFTVIAEEIQEELILSKNHVEGDIPLLKGYTPISVEYTGSTDVFSYNAETRKFTIDREAIIREDGTIATSIARKNEYKIKIVYPIEAYKSIETEAVTLRIPVRTYYEGYNNSSEEFTNPYKSNIASMTIVENYNRSTGYLLGFEIMIGKVVSEPTSRFIVEKEKPLKIYNGISETETDDTYIVRWQAHVSQVENKTGIIMKETLNGQEQVSDTFIKTDSSKESAEDVVSNTGIYFSEADTMLGADGWIKVYDEDTGNLLVTFTANDWNNYDSTNLYKYETPVKHIRIETSEVIGNNSYLYVYNVKEINDEKITEKYEREEFDELQYIQSTLVGYLGKSYINTDTHQANYEAPSSVATINISNNTMSTQKTEKNDIITITANADTLSNQVEWENGTFLIKLPEEIIDVKINNIEISNSDVTIESYELIERDGSLFIKIVTQNDVPQTYNIKIDVDLSADPRNATATRQIELYASNEKETDYFYKEKDKYDVNNNLNLEEYVNYTTTSLSMVSPNALLTNQVATEFDDKGSEVISPQIADIKPIYAGVDQEKKEQTVKIGAQLRNNYTSTISEIQILGKIPFEGNTYVLTGDDLGSTFTTKMTNTGIEIPDELQEYATVYYSENENPTNDVNDESNGWVLADQVVNWDNIKTYLINLNDYVMPVGKEYVFNYTIKIPNGIEFNEVSYSHHGIYFCLDTDEGKYSTSTEPSKLGLRISEKLDLELTKYQAGKDKLVPGATYSLTEIIRNEEGKEARGESKTEVTNEQGNLTITNLYVEKTYELKEIKTPEEYVLNVEKVRFIFHVDEQGNLTMEIVQGTIRGDETITKEDNEKYKVQIAVEDEIKSTLKIVKQDQETGSAIKGARFKITGYGLPENGRTFTTSSNGELTVKGLSINQEYTLQEVKANGYYLANKIKFKIVNEDETYKAEVTELDTTSTESTNIKNIEVSEEDSIPKLILTLGNEAIPTYNLQIVKIEKTTESTLSKDELIAKVETDLGNTEIKYLEGAKFKLYKGTEEIGEYITDGTGTITIQGLYQYVSEKGVDQTYTLKEVLIPEGYSKVKDISFKVEEKDGTLVLTEIDADGKEIESSRYTVDGNTIKLIVEDSPSFKLIKKDAETKEVLANIKFAIYNIDEGTEKIATNSKGEILGTKEIINGKEYYVIETDENGELTADLTEGLYKIVEVQAPDKYDISNSIYYFGIGASRDAQTTYKATQAMSIGEYRRDQINSVVGTSDGGYIAVGSLYSDSITVGNYTLTNAGGFDGMIIKYDANGTVEWATSVGGSNSDYITSVAEIKEGGYIVGGVFNGNIKVGIYTLSNTGGMIIKYDDNGGVEWATGIGGSDLDEITSVAGTNDGGYIVAGNFNSSNVTIDKYNLVNAGSQDGMVIKYDANNQVEWATSIGGSGRDQINSVVETSDGGYIVGGYFESNITVGSYNLVSMGLQDAMVIKYDVDGTVELATGIGGSGLDEITSVAGTKDEGYIVTGQFNSSNITVGDYTIKESSIIKYNKNNEMEWVTSIDSGISAISSVAENSDGDYIIGGNFSGNIIKVGDYILTNSTPDMYLPDGMIIIYDADGKVKWATSIGGYSEVDGEYAITSVAGTKDGGFVAGGYINNSAKINDEIMLTNAGGIVVKYEGLELNNPITFQAQSIGGESYEEITTISKTSDGGYIVGGYFSSNITVGNYNLVNTGSKDGMVIKYDVNGQIEWLTSIGGETSDQITSVLETSDGGYIVGGYFSGNITVGNYNLVSTGMQDGMLIKYDTNGQVEWATSIGGNNGDYIESIAETSDKGYIVGGYFNSSNITVGNYNLVNAGYQDGMIIKYSSEGEVEWATDIGGNNGDYIESIAGTSDGGYIVGGRFNSSNITVGNYNLVNAGYQDGMIIKYSSEGKVEWATSIGENSIEIINSVVGTSDGGCIVGGEFGSDITVGDYTLICVGSSDGMVIKYSKDGAVEWATSIGEYREDSINSVFETSDGGYIVGGEFYNSITTGNYTINSVGGYDGMIIKYDANGQVEWAKSIGGASSDYINSVIEANNGEYIAVGYFNSSTIETDGKTLTNAGFQDGMILKIVNQVGVPEVQELTVENNRKELKITTDIEEIDGVKGGSISGEDQNPYETVKYGNSSINTIKMTPSSGYEIIKITINGEELSDYKIASDGSYTLPSFSNMTEDKHIVVTYVKKSNKLTIIKKDAKDGTLLSGAKFELTQIIEDGEPYTETLETKKNGETATQIPYGQYTITEIEAPEGYEALKESITIQFSSSGISVIENNNGVDVTVGANGELVIENNQTAKVIVHHYLKTEDGTYTTTKVAEDEMLEGKIGDKYVAIPHLDLEKYQLEKDAEGNYVVPGTATGQFKEEVQEVIYYYEIKDIPLIVHHYIEGTEDKVPLSDGNLAEDEEFAGKEGEQYTTDALTEKELNEKYELVELPENATGTYEGNSIEVIYYYKIKVVEITSRVEGEGGSISGEKEKPYEEVEYGEDSLKDIIAVPEEGYRVSKITVNGEKIAFTANEDGTVELDKFIEMKEDKEVVVSFEKIPGQVIVHHYIYNKETGEYTTNKVPSKQGGVVEDEIKTGVIGDIYASKISENVSPNYEYVSSTNNTSGEMTEETIEIIYYYQLKEGKITENTIEKTGTNKITQEDQEVSYTINYKAIVDEYIGNAEITIIDKLPYEIDEKKSNILGGVYNAAEKTITWIEKVENIDTYANEAKEINISKNITVVYVNMDYSKTNFENITQGTIVLEETKQEENTQESRVTTETEFTKQVEVTKVWEHTNNIYGIPEEVKIQVKNGADVVAEKVLNNSNKTVEDENIWKWTFTGLPKYNSQGQEINYTVDEVNEGNLNYYKKEIDGTTIKNTYNGPVITANKEVETENSLSYVVEGEKITYTIRVQNSGDLATDVLVKDNIPEGTRFVEGSIKVNGVEDTSKTATDLTNGIRINVPARIDENTSGKTTISFEVMVNVLEGNILTKNITNIAAVNKNPNNPASPDEPTNEVTTTVNKPDLKYSKSSEPISGDAVKEGDEITYTIHLDNRTGTAPISAVVKDNIPSGTTFVEGSIKVGGQTQQTMTAENLASGINVDLGAGESKDIEFKVTVNDLDNGVIIRNVATVNNEPTNETEHTYIEAIITANKEVATENSLSYVVEGEKITYTIRVQNRGDLAQDVLVKDSIPEGSAFVEGSIKVGEQAQEGMTSADLSNGIRVNVPAREDETTAGEITVSFEVIVNSLPGEELTKDIKNTATVNKQPDKPDSPDEPTNEVTTTVNKPDLKYNKSSNPTSGSTVKVGDEITYTIHLDNRTGTAPTRVVVKDSIPSGTTFVEGSIKVGGQLQEGMTAENLVSGINVDLQAGESKDIEFKVTVNDLDNGVIIRNVATVNDEPTNETEHTYVEAIITANKEATTENNLSYVVEGEKITYTIRLQNRGDLAADVVVKDNIPEGTSFVEGSIKINGVEDTPKTATDLTNGIRVNVPARQNEITPGETTVSFEVTVNDLDNGAKIRNAGTVNDEPTNETEHTYVEAIITANKEVTTENNLNYVIEGEKITYTIRVQNRGDLAQGVVIKDNIPEGATFVEGSIKVGGHLQEGMTAADLSNGIRVNVPARQNEATQGETTVSFDVTVNVLEGNTLTKDITNTATVNKEPDKPDSPDEPTNEVITTVNKSDLKYNKSSNPTSGSKVKVGDEITYTIHLDNKTGTAPTNAVVKDNIPNGTTFVEESIKVGGQVQQTMTVENLANGINVDLGAGESKDIEFKVTVNDLDNGVIIRNVATVNNEPTNETEHTYVEAIITANKEATTENNLSYVVEGEKITYTIRVQNSGDLATDVLVKDNIPEGTTFVKESIKVNGVTDTSKGEKELVNGIRVNVPARTDKDTQEEITVSFEVIVNSLSGEELTKEIKNTATVNKQPDKPDSPDEPTNEVITTVNKSDLKYNKSSNPTSGSTVKVGDEITYTIHLDNRTGTAPTRVVVKDSIPSGTTFVEGSIKVGGELQERMTAENLANGINVDLGAGESKDVEFKVTVNDLDNGAIIRNVATVNNEPTNETEHTYIEAIITANKEATTENNLSYVVEGEKITYTIRLQNSGDLAQDVLVKDSIPEGSAFVEGSIKVGEQAQEGMTSADLSNGIRVNVPARENETTAGEITVTFEVTVNSLPDEELTKDIRNTAKINKQPDKPESQDEPTNEVTTTVNKSDLKYNKSSNPTTGSTVKVGDEITYTIHLDNRTGTAPTRVVVKDTIPNGTTFVEGSIKVGVLSQLGMTAENLANGISVDLGAGESKDVEFKVTVNDLDNGAKIRNIATVNDEPTKETEHTYVEAIIRANKEMTTEKGLGYVIEGEKITYTIRVQNSGDLAQDVLVKDSIPEGSTFVEGSIKVGGQSQGEMTATDLSNGIKVNVPARKSETTPGEITVSFEVKVNNIREETSKTIRNTGYVNKEPDKPESPDEPTNEVTVPVLIYKKTAEIIRNGEIDQSGNNNITEGAVTAGDRIKYTITINNIGEEAIRNVKVKDTVPEGTTIYVINDNGSISLNDKNEITWNIEQIATGEEKQVSFEVTVKYDTKEKIIKNVGTVDGKETNEVETPYEVPKSDLESNIVKDGSEKITSTEEKISYTIEYKVEVREFIGKGKLKIIDYLPYEIDEANSELNGGTYNKQSKTITWEEDLGEINTYANGDGTKEIERTKTLTLKYMYPNVENLSGTIGNRAEGTITLTQDNITVKEETKEDTHEVKVEVPTVVIVHHYIYDESKGGETTEKVPSREGGKVADEEINGLVGQRYDTNPSNKINENYECINVTPDKHEGTMTKTPIEVTYYYKLKEVELGAIIDKTATANKQEELEYETGEYDEQGQPITAIKTVQVLTSENGVVTYKIKFRAGIKDYKGKATITIIDKLPASLDEEDSRIELSGGTYDATKKTITWKEEIQVDTFATGAIYDQTFEKEIKVVYKEQRITETLVNTAEGTITIYYPEEHSTKPGEERDSVTVTETAEVEQEYKVTKEVEKVWDDNNNIKGNRPRSVTIQLKANGSTYYNGEQLEKVVLSDANNWKYTFTDLPKYTENGQEIKYSVVETETNLGDLEYYDVPVITEIDNKITVTNKYKLINTRLESSIEKTGTDKITASKEEVTYNINYKVTVTDYIGEALVRIVDTLPYELAKQADGIDLAGGTYDENTRTITWEERIGHINTYTNGDYEIEINKTIKVVYGNLDATQKGMTNTVKGTIDLYETEKTNTVEDTHNTTIEIPGKVIVKYIDKETGNEIADGYEINGMAGDMYATTQKQIPGYTYVENTNNTRGNMIEGTIEVKYYYERTIAGGVLVTYVDENGNKIAEDETYEGKVGDPYKTEQKEIEGYDFVRVEGNTEGELTEGVIKVEYVYKKIPAKVIVRYLEKDETEDDSDNKVLETEEIISGYVGDSYITNRKEIKNYKSAEPEPENKQGIMTKEDIYVTYYYEKIPSGKVISQYVDIDTKEEILYKDEETGEYKTYEEESKGYIGDRYQTEQKDIPYYKIVKELIPTNKEGEYTAEDIYVTYYYEKLAFNIGVDKNVAKIEINGKEQKVLNGKLNKIEVVARQINNTEVKITYSIKVSNTGELKGTAKLLENIPENFNINGETGKEWTKNAEGNLEANVELQAGETKELKVVLNWIKGENNFGTQKNTVEIVEIANPANYEETTTEDNKSEAEVVMGIRTGDIIKTITTISAWTGMVIAIIIFLYLSNKYIKLHKEKDMK